MGTKVREISRWVGGRITALLDDKADLVNGLVPANQLPSYVDDVVEVANYAALPVSGETGKIYVAIDTAFTYRWTGAVYVLLNANLVEDQIVNAVVDKSPSQNAVFDALALKANTSDIEDAIADGVTTKAPSQNAVFDALALKADTSAVSSGTYAPTLTVLGGAVTAANTSARYIKVGNIVYVTVRCLLTSTGSAIGADIGFSLPVASDLAATSAEGVAVFEAPSGNTTSGNVVPDAATDTLTANTVFIATVTVGQTVDMTITASYSVI